MSDFNTEIKSAIDGIKAGIGGFDQKFNDLQRQVDFIDQKMHAPSMASFGQPKQDGIEFFMKQLNENRSDFDRLRRLVIKTPSLFETKSTVTSTGLFAADAAAAVNGAGRFTYMLRDIFRSTPAGAGSVFNVRTTVESTSPTSQAAEGDTKAESSYTLTGDTITIPTIAHFVNVSRQALDDVVGLGEFLRSTLIWGLHREAERQMLAGAGVSGVMSGIITTAQSFDSTILVASQGWQIADVLAAAACQLSEDGYNPDFFVISPRTWLRAILTKDSTGQYIIGGPQSAVTKQMWSMKAVVSDQLTANQFVVGDSSAALIRPRMEAQIDISDSHDQNFVKNLLTLRAEERLVLQKLRPDGFVYGAPTTSPA
jgi:HK97 family phage major capsid protein